MEIKDLVSPFDKNYCNYFYFLMWFFIIAFVISLGLLVYGLFTTSSKDRLHVSINVISLLINILLAYFTNRLFYSMCVNSLK
jgi:hypothetical protein